MTVAMEKNGGKFDVTYTRMLIAIKNKNWNLHLTNEELYKNIPKISDTIRKQRLRFADIVGGVRMNWLVIYYYGTHNMVRDPVAGP